MGEGNWHHEKSPSENIPNIRHELLVGLDTRGKNSKVEQTVKNFLASEISMPDGWTPTTSNRTTMSMKTFQCPGDSASLNLFDRGMPVNAQSSEGFNKLLDDNQHLSRPKDLTPGEIKKLRQVLGTTTAGDNQYTNDAKPGDPHSPAFHMFSAQLVPLNGKTVLEVQGNFVGDNGSKGKEFRGIFVPTGENGSRIKEFFLQADNAVDAAKHTKDFKASLASIKW